MIDDPLKRLYGDIPKTQETVRNPTTGIRESIDTLKRMQNSDDEVKRKKAVARRIVLQLMQDDVGREWMYDKLAATGIFTSPFHVDPKLQDFNCGAFHVGREIEKELKLYAPREFMTMCLEAWDREEQWASEAAAA